MEAINGWVKAELFMDFHVTGIESIEHEIANYITFFNEQRPAYSMSDNDESSEQKNQIMCPFFVDYCNRRNY